MTSVLAGDRVFLSYSHESPEHQSRVRLLYELLREQGVDAHGDFGAEPRDWAEWTEEQVRCADRILVIASPGYRQQAEAEGGGASGRGVRFEWKYIRSAIYTDDQAATDKVVCVLMPGTGLTDVPAPLSAASRNHCRVASLTLEGMTGLLRRLFRQPYYVAPPIVRRPDLDLPECSILAAYRLVVETLDGRFDPTLTRNVLNDAGRRADLSTFDLGLDIDSGHGIFPLVSKRDVLGRWIRALREAVDARPSAVRVRVGLALADPRDAGLAADLASGETARALHGVPQGQLIVVRSATFHAVAGPLITRFPPQHAYREETRDRTGGPTCWVAVAGLPDCPRTPPPNVVKHVEPSAPRPGGRGDEYHVAITIRSSEPRNGR